MHRPAYAQVQAADRRPEHRGLLPARNRIGCPDKASHPARDATGLVLPESDEDLFFDRYSGSTGPVLL